MEEAKQQHDAERRPGIERRHGEQAPGLVGVDARHLERILGPAGEIELFHQPEIVGRTEEDGRIGLVGDLLAVIVVVSDAPLVLDEAQAEIKRVRQPVRRQPL